MTVRPLPGRVGSRMQQLARFLALAAEVFLVIDAAAAMMTKFPSSPPRRVTATVSALAICLAGWTATRCAWAGGTLDSPILSTGSPGDGLPRKVLLGTIVSGYDVIFKLPLERRFQRMDEFVD